MANFRSKDLTISIPEKGSGEPGTGCTCNTNIQQTQALQIHPTTTIWTGHTTIVTTTINYTCHIFTCGYGSIISPGTCTTTHPYLCGPTNCTFSATTPVTLTPIEGQLGGEEISAVKDHETLNALKEKLVGALREVDEQLARTK